jgi:hypothetical protein
VYFVSQNPLDIPDAVLGQLGNRVQHALRAFTPRDQKAVKSAATTFRSNPKLEVASVITELGVGEALVSFLDEKGIPTPVERTFVCPPGSRIGPATDAERIESIRTSVLNNVYEKQVDRESAYEILKTHVEATAAEDAELATSSSKKQPVSRSDGILEAAAKSAARAIGSQLGRQIIRGILGSILGGRK